MRLLQTSLGMKVKDPSWLVSHASVEMIAHGPFCGQNSPLMMVGVGCSCGNASPAPPSPDPLVTALALEVAHVLPAVPLPLVRLHTDARTRAELLHLLNLSLENLHRLWGRKCNINTEKCLWDVV